MPGTARRGDRAKHPPPANTAGTAGTVVGGQNRVIGSWLAMFRAALDSRGIDGSHFLARRGIDFQHLVDPTQRIGYDTMAGLWRDAVALSGDDGFGLHAGRFATAHTFGALGVALSAACTVEDHIACMIRYGALFATMAPARLAVDGDLLVYRSPVPRRVGGRTASSPWSQDAICSAMHHLRRTQFGSLYRPRDITLARPAPADPDRFTQVFGCPVSFGADAIRIRVDLQAARTRVPGSDPALARATERLAADFLDQLYRSDDLLGDLRQVLLWLLPDGQAGAEAAARKLHMSPRTLHRRLEALGTSYSAQLDHYRHELACRYLRDQNLGIGEVGDLLGFASNASFSRAFKRWTGASPRAYRHADAPPA